MPCSLYLLVFFLINCSSLALLLSLVIHVRPVDWINIGFGTRLVPFCFVLVPVMVRESLLSFYQCEELSGFQNWDGERF